MSDTVHAYCRCGGSTTARSSTPGVAFQFVDDWRRLGHSGEGCGPATREVASAARRRQRREEAAAERAEHLAGKRWAP